jgi:hypothetical protein
MTTPYTPPYVYRHPLGLPAGSVRAVLTLMIVGLFLTLLALSATGPVPVQVPLFLYFLTGLVLVFFAAHGHSIGDPADTRSPLNLPRGSIRLILLLGIAGVAGWLFYKHPDRLREAVTPDPEQLKQWPVLLGVTAGGYFLGYLIGRGPWRRAAAFQDILAWISLLAMIGLTVETVWVIFINPSLRQEFDLRTWEAVLAATVSFYYGARC